LKQSVRFWQRLFTLGVMGALVLVTALGISALPTLGRAPTAHAADSGCVLQSARGDIQHVIYIQFDNTHFTRDNPNVPSDLEQMLHLLNFIE
jgi:hypothetical protein